jgi:hypothetical protein
MIRRLAALAALLVVGALVAAALARQLVPSPDRGRLAAPVSPSPTPALVAASPTSRAQRAKAIPSAAPPTVDVAGEMQVAGPASVDTAVVDAALRREGSPLAGLGETIVAEGRHWGIDPVYLVAFVTYFDAGAPLPVAAHNVGHIRAVGAETAINGYRVFPTWQAGIDAWYRLIATLYVRRWGLTTLDRIVPVYAPGSGRRSVEAELNTLRAAVEALRGLARV